MACSYYGTDYNQAMLEADICEYIKMTEELNAITAQYNLYLNDAQIHFNESARLQNLSILVAKTMPSQKLMSTVLALNAEKETNAGLDLMESAALLIDPATTHSFTTVNVYGQAVMTGCAVYQGGTCVAPIFTIYYYLIYAPDTIRTYEGGIARVDQLADIIAGYSSWSFSIDFTGGTFLLDASTFVTLIDVALKVANNIGLISDDKYASIVTSKYFGIAMAIGSSMLSGYVNKSFGMTSTPLGYMSNNLATEMFTTDVKNVFKTLDAIKTAYYMGLMITNEFDDVEDKDDPVVNDAIEEIELQRRLLRSKHENNNRYMPIDNMMKVAEQKYNRVGNYRVFNSK